MLSSCTRDFPALVGNSSPPVNPLTSPSSTSICSCTTTPPASTSTTPVAGGGGTQPTIVDTLDTPPPHFSPNGGNFHFSVTVQLTADSLPPQAVYEYSMDDGQNWQVGQKLILTTGGKILTRLRVGDKISRSRPASFNLYFERMLVIGNSIMSHLPDPTIGWYNSNGMAASAPEKDFVHLLTSHLQTLYPPMTVRLQSGGGFEREFGKPAYTMGEFNEPLEQFKPDLIVLRIGENVDDGDVPSRHFEDQLRQLLDRLANYGKPVKIVTTTSVWNRPQTDAVLRKVITERGSSLVDLSCMVGQGQYFASQYADGGVAAHPNDAGMERIAELIWAKIQ